MKKLLLILLVAVTAASACSKKVPSEQIIADFAQHFDEKGDRYTDALTALTPEKRAAYIMLQLGKEVNSADVWTSEFEPEDGAAGEVIVAELRTRKKDASMSMLSACLEDPAACAAVLDVLDAFKQEKIRPAFALRAVFYYGGETGVEGMKQIVSDFRQDNELAVFDIEVSSRDSIPERTFLIEDKPLFAEKVVEVIPAYLMPVCDVSVETGEYPREGWPTSTPTYRYRLGADRIADLKALTAFTFLLN